MSKLFDFKDIRNKPSRNGFDLSNKMAFTAKVGELLPVYWKNVMPGDKFTLKTQHFTRTAPVQSAAFTRMREYFDWFFVPLRLLHKSSSQILTQMTENPVVATSMSENLLLTESLPYLRLSDLVGTTGVAGSSPLSVLQHLVGKNSFGFYRSNLMLKLLSYLGYGQFNDSLLSDRGTPVDNKHNPYAYDVPVNLFPLAAYQKIYQDYYRNTQWENASPYCYNFDYSAGGLLTIPGSSDRDYWSNPTMFDLRYCNFNKDLFMGLLPESQLGDVASLSFGVDIPPINVGDIVSSPDSSGGQLFLPSGSLQVQLTDGDRQTWDDVRARNGSSTGIQFDSGDSQYQNVYNSDSNLRVQLGSGSVALPNYKNTDNIYLGNLQSSFNVLQLRQVEFLQRWKEIAQCGNQDYRDQIYRHFGVKLPATLGNICQYVGGSVSQLDINEVVNQAFTDSPDSLANLKGKGVGVGESYDEFSADEYGILMCIYHCVPLLDYAISGIDKGLLKTSAYDYAIPEFDKIGFEELEDIVFRNSSSTAAAVSDTPYTLGYVPRYIDYKTSYDRVVGDFVQSEQMKTWVAPVTDSYILAYSGSTPYPNLDYNFFKVNPSIVNPLFYSEADSTVSTDCLMINSYFDVKAVRNLDYNGLPY